MMWTRIRGLLGRSRSIYPFSLPESVPFVLLLLSAKASLFPCVTAYRSWKSGDCNFYPNTRYVYTYLSWFIYSIYTNLSVHLRCLFHQGLSRCTTVPWCGFSILEISRGEPVLFFFCENRAVRCGAVRFSLFSKSYGAVRCGFSPWRCGEVRITFFEDRTVRCGAVRLTVEQLFPTVRLSVHRSSTKNPSTVLKSYCSRLPSKCQRHLEYTGII